MSPAVKRHDFVDGCTHGGDVTDRRVLYVQLQNQRRGEEGMV